MSQRTRTGRIAKRYLDEMPGDASQELVDGYSTRSTPKPKNASATPPKSPKPSSNASSKPAPTKATSFSIPSAAAAPPSQVAQHLNRRWIGIDITHLAINLIKNRLADAFGPEITSDLRGHRRAHRLRRSRRSSPPKTNTSSNGGPSAWWARAPPSRKKGADRGIDGRLYFHDDDSGESKQIIFSVKGGGRHRPPGPRPRGVIEREKAEIGVFISFEEPTKPMRNEAAEAGFYTSADGSHLPAPPTPHHPGPPRRHQRLQHPLHGRDATFKKAPRSRPDAAENLTLNLLDE